MGSGQTLHQQVQEIFQTANINLQHKTLFTNIIRLIPTAVSLELHL